MAELFRPPQAGSVFADTIFDLQYDPMDIIRSIYQVKTKSSRVIPFTPFRTQSLYMERLGHRNVTVKPRQVGSTTINLLMGHSICITTPNVSMLVVTHLDEATASMRETLQNWTKWLNDTIGFGIGIGKDNADEMEFSHNNSKIYFGTGGGSGRSRTIQILLASEVAHWQGKDPGKELGGMTESVPDRGLVFVESTPLGAAGPFFGLYNGKNNGYVKHFFPWFMEPSRSIDLKGERLTLTEEELLLVSMHRLTHGQIAWRRAKKAQMSADASSPPFEQEYPEDDITCFTAGTKTAFPAPRLAELLKMANIASRIEHDNQDIDRILGPKDSWDPGGTLSFWGSPDPTHRYVVTCDVGGGHADGDPSVAIVRDHTLMGAHVATLEGHWSPEKFADLTCKLAEMYNKAYLCHESNGLGLGAVNRAVNQHKYANYHWEQKVADDGKMEWRGGLYIKSGMRNEMLVSIKQEVIDNRFFSRDVNLIREMTATQLVRKQVAGRWMDVIQLPSNVHDDHLMAYAQGTRLLKEVVFNATPARPVQVM